MAGGTFDKGISKIRPGTYTNFEDSDQSLVSVNGSGVSGGGGGGGAKPKDYIIGKINTTNVATKSNFYGYEYPLAGENVCGG
jgi:hypothetical protein